MVLKKVNLITSNHKKTKRNYLQRMMNDKINSMKISKNMNLIIGMAKEIRIRRLQI